MPTRTLLISSTAFETRAALLEDGIVVEVFFERRGSRGLAGNVYQGRVRKILPGMQSAFVDVGLERDAFLYVSDVIDGRTRWARELDAAELEPPPPPVPIEQRLREGQELIVQIAKEPIAGKGARITTHVSLPGRYLVYLPTVEHVGVSRKIDDSDERARLKLIGEALKAESGGGFIVRTAGAGTGPAELADDVAELRLLWKQLQERSGQASAPLLLHGELSLLDRLLRDLVAGDFGEIVVEEEADRARCVEFLNRLASPVASRVRVHPEAGRLFGAYGVEDAIEKALRHNVWLKSGGYIVINQTEALVAIDVNTGRYVGKNNLEETALKTNLDAAKEIVRQVRLRDLGGIIVIDFIDMVVAENRDRVMTELELLLQSDRARTRALPMSEFGLVQLTRKRVKGSLERTLTVPCSHCSGTGFSKSVETLCHEIHRDILRTGRDYPGAGIRLRTHSAVADALLRQHRELVDDLERRLQRRIEVIGEDGLQAAQYFCEPI